MRRLLLFASCAVATILTSYLFWRWMGEPVALPDVPGGRLHCLSYTPIEPGRKGESSPGWVSDARIADDVRLLAEYTDCLRLYTPLGTSPRVVEQASRAGLHVLLGAWIGSDLDQNEKEIRAALELANRYPQTVRMIVVGNEVLLRRELAADRLAALIRDVKERSPVPVAYADIAHFIEQEPVVAEPADVLLIHLLPYWDDPEPPRVEAAAGQVLAIHREFSTRFPGKEVWIGETGWPSKGRMRGPGRPGLVSEARFVREFAARAGAAAVRYNLIEALDEPWKRYNEGTVGGYWGILDEQRRPKFALQGPVSAWPQWRTQFVATASLALLALLAGARRRAGALSWISRAAVSLALALTLVFQYDYVHAAAQSAWGMAGGVAAALFTVVAAASPGRTGRDGVASIRELAAGLRKPRALLRSPPLRLAAWLAPVMIAAAWVSITLAFEPRFRDIPLARFALPAAAAAILLTGAVRAAGDHREEAVLALVLLSCGVLQLEPANPQSIAWLGICVLLALPWLGALRRELARIRGVLTDARQSK